MPSYRYPRDIILIDGLRAALGLLITLGPLLFLSVSRPVALLLIVLGLLFLWFAKRVLEQGLISIKPSAEGLACEGLRRQFLAWESLNGLKLAYYAPIRRRQDGWYQLTLRSGEDCLRLDSTLLGFSDVLERSVAAARHVGLTFDPSTLDNLRALGHPTEDTTTSRLAV